jgi:hypothetical protein
MNQVSNNIIECLTSHNVDCAQNGLIDYLFWLVVGLIITYIVKLLYNFYQAIKIKESVLLENRVGSSGLNSYVADRFKEIWQSDLNKPPKLGGNSNFVRPRWSCEIVDKKLVEYKLVKIDDTNFEYKAVLPIKDQRNKLVFWFIKRYFIKFMNEKT